MAAIDTLSDLIACLAWWIYVGKLGGVITSGSPVVPRSRTHAKSHKHPAKNLLRDASFETADPQPEIVDYVRLRINHRVDSVISIYIYVNDSNFVEICRSQFTSIHSARVFFGTT